MISKSCFKNFQQTYMIFTFVFGFNSFFEINANNNFLGLFFDTQYHLSLDLMKNLKNLFGVNVLFETGTYFGDTASKGAGEFDFVYTVELSDTLYAKAKNKLNKFSNVTCYNGNSADFITQDLKELNGNILFWLDAHYSAGVTTTLYSADGRVKSPLRDELLAIKKLAIPTSVILIDDIRVYPNVPYQDNNDRDYITVEEIKEIIESIPGYRFYILGDSGLGFNSSLYSISCSDAVKACTQSYVFNMHLYSSEDLKNVIEAEYLLMNVMLPEEELVVDALYNQFALKPEGRGFYPALWKGLLAMQHKKYHQAVKIFSYIVENSANYHDRIIAYLAFAQQKRGFTAKAKKNFARCNPDVLDAVKLAWKDILR